MTVNNHGPLTKALLHALTHSSRDVYGLLIGPSQTTPEIVTRTIPLFHSRCITTPLLRAGLSLVEQTMTPDSHIVGLYCAQVTACGSSISPLGKWIASQICKTLRIDSLQCWVYDQKLAKLDGTEWPFEGVVIKSDDSIRPSHARLEHGYNNEYVRDMVNNIHRATTLPALNAIRVIDLEDHLQDPTREWLSSN